jgi:hypothetical protein
MPLHPVGSKLASLLSLSWFAMKMRTHCSLPPPITVLTCLTQQGLDGQLKPFTLPDDRHYCSQWCGDFSYPTL